MATKKKTAKNKKTRTRALVVKDTDAAEIGRLYCKARQSMVDSVSALLECGQRLAAKKKTLGHGNWLAWVENNADILGFSSIRTADRLMRAAAKTKLDASVQYDELSATQVCREIWGHVTGSAATIEHRAKVAAAAKAAGVTDAPTDKYRILYADPPWDYGIHAQPDYQTEIRLGTMVYTRSLITRPSSVIITRL